MLVPPQKHNSLLEVRELTVQYRTECRPPVVALRGVSLVANAGEIIGVLGESGSGKSTLALALCRLLPNSAEILGGFIQFRDLDLLASVRRIWKLSAAHRSRFWGRIPIRL